MLERKSRGGNCGMTDAYNYQRVLHLGMKLIIYSPGQFMNFETLKKVARGQNGDVSSFRRSS